MNALADVAPKFDIPTIEYGALAPILIVLGAAVVSVLVEAVLPQRYRRNTQLVIVLLALVGSFVAVVAARGTQKIVAMGSVAIDGPTLFMQGTILVLAAIAALVMAERKVDPAGDSFAPRASALPGSEDEQAFTRLGWLQTEVWSLFLFCIGGMLLFPASSDLLTMFVALEILSLPLYVMVGLARRRRLLSQEALAEVLRARRLLLRVLPFGTALLYGYAGTVSLSGDRRRAHRRRPATPSLVLAGVAMLSVGLLFKIGAAPFHQWTPDVYQGSPHLDHRLHGGLHQGGRLRRAVPGHVRRPRRDPLGLASDDVRHRRAHDDRRHPLSRSPGQAAFPRAARGGWPDDHVSAAMT